MSEYALAVWQCTGCGEHILYGGRYAPHGDVEVFGGAIMHHVD